MKIIEIKSKYKWQRYFRIDDRPLGESKIELAHLWNEKKSLCGLRKEQGRSGKNGEKYLTLSSKDKKGVSFNSAESWKKNNMNGSRNAARFKICKKCLELENEERKKEEKPDQNL